MKLHKEFQIKENLHIIHQQQVNITHNLATYLLHKYFTGKHDRVLQDWTNRYEIEHPVGDKIYCSTLYFPQQGSARIGVNASIFPNNFPVSEWEIDEDGDLIIKEG